MSTNVLKDAPLSAEKRTQINTALDALLASCTGATPEEITLLRIPAVANMVQRATLLGFSTGLSLGVVEDMMQTLIKQQPGALAPKTAQQSKE
jgi:hypothetical protein